MLFETDRRTDDRPVSGKLPPDDDRWNTGCCGRLIVGLTDVDRAC